jgi:hypothetical protein
MSQVSEVIDKVTRQLLSGTVEERNKLAASVNTSATTVTFSFDLEGIRKGTVLEINGEQMYVWSVVTASKTATVERGFNGTTPQAHAANAICTVNPRFPRNQILEAINAELADLSSPINGLFQIKTVELRYGGSDRMIDMTGVGYVQDVYNVHYRDTSDNYPRVSGWRLLRDMPVTDFPSGMALDIGNMVSRATNLVIKYKTEFDPISNEQQDLFLSSGLPETCEDLIILGAQIRLIAPREIKRNFTESQGDTRRAAEVPPGSIGGSITNLLRLKRDRVAAEAQRLNRLYPVLMV